MSYIRNCKSLAYWEVTLKLVTKFVITFKPSKASSKRNEMLFWLLNESTVAYLTPVVEIRVDGLQDGNRYLKQQMVELWK